MKLDGLHRLLNPRSVAVVGASETLPMSRNIVQPLIAAGREVFLINPRHATLFGAPTHASLDAIGKSVDAVVSLVNADLSVDVVRQAGSLQCGGVVAIAGGFGESDARGAVLQRALTEGARAARLAVIGPNCAGYMNVHDDTWLFTGARLPVAAGGISVVSQSGFFTRAAFAAGLERRLGFRYGVSSGNEAVCDLAEYLEYLVADEKTRVICLVIEKVRDASRFFAAARQAREKQKPIIALKLGRTETGRAISQSHTGSIADDAWVYEVALRQAGVLIARDVDDMLDQAQLFEQLDSKRWKPMPRVAVITTSGGVAAYAADLFGDEGVELPVPPDVGQWVREHIPEAGIANPIDMTGFVVGRAETTNAMFDCYAEAFDAVVLAWWSGEYDENWATRLTAPFVDSAQRNPAAVMALTAAHSGAFGDWAVALRDRGVVVARGLRPLARAIRAMHGYMTSSVPGQSAGPADEISIRPAVVPIDTPQGRLLPFAATMDLLRSAGVAVAPFVLIDATDVVAERVAVLQASMGDAPVGARAAAFAVKLANVAHRTEHGAVEVGVAPRDVPVAVKRLRDIALRDGLDAQVAVQAMARGNGELFVGVQGTSDLGPVLVCGLGGVFVELLKKVSGRMLPLAEAEADALLDEAAGDFISGFRGQAPWHRQSLRDVLLGVGRIGSRGREWIASLDLNPVICSAEGCVVVDATCIVKGETLADARG